MSERKDWEITNRWASRTLRKGKITEKRSYPESRREMMNTCFVNAVRTGGWTGIKDLKDVAVSIMKNINHCATMLRSSSV